MIPMNGAEHHVHREGLGRERAALEYLAHVNGEPKVGTPPDRKSGNRGIVACTAGDDHVRALVERRADWLVPHLRHERDGFLDVFLSEIVAGLKIHRLAGADRGDDAVCWDVGVDPRQLQLQPAFAHDFAHDGDGPVDMGAAARAASAADDHRDLCLAPRLDQLRQFPLHA